MFGDIGQVAAWLLVELLLGASVCQETLTHFGRLSQETLTKTL